MKIEVANLLGYLQATNLKDAVNYVLALKKTHTPIEIKEIIYLCSDPDDGVGLLVYTLINELVIENGENVFWNEVARDILSNSLCHLKFSYAAALHHAKKVCEYDDSNLDAWITYLDIGRNRTRLLDETSAKVIASKILSLDPNNRKGRAYL